MSGNVAGNSRSITRYIFHPNMQYIEKVHVSLCVCSNSIDKVGRSVELKIWQKSTVKVSSFIIMIFFRQFLMLRLDYGWSERRPTHTHTVHVDVDASQYFSSALSSSSSSGWSVCHPSFFYLSLSLSSMSKGSQQLFDSLFRPYVLNTHTESSREALRFFPSSLNRLSIR